LRVQLCMLRGETQPSLKIKKLNTTCPVVYFYSHCLVVMIIVIQEYMYKVDLSCSSLLFSLRGGHDNYDTGIQEVQIRHVL
jgi:hypothetical protein